MTYLLSGAPEVRLGGGLGARGQLATVNYWQTKTSAIKKLMFSYYKHLKVT